MKRHWIIAAGLMLIHCKLLSIGSTVDVAAELWDNYLLQQVYNLLFTEDKGLGELQNNKVFIQFLLRIPSNSFSDKNCDTVTSEVTASETLQNGHQVSIWTRTHFLARTVRAQSLTWDTGSIILSLCCSAVNDFHATERILYTDLEGWLTGNCRIYIF